MKFMFGLALWMLVLPSCALLSRGEDAVFEVLVNEAIDFCKKEYHRRLGYYTIIHGELAKVGIDYGGFICPGDPETETE